MTTVYIWTFRGKAIAWGHASMLVDRTYLSWWPEGEGRIRSPLHPHLYTASPFRNRTFQDDVRAEEQQPDHTIRLEGLEEDAIKDWWQSFGLTRDGLEFLGPLPPWETLRQNCSTVVAVGLKKGGGDQYAAWHKSWNLVWSPNDVLQYALSIQQGLNRQRK